MDQPQKDVDDAPERARREESDLLDQAVLPLFGLSPGTVAAIFLGGAMGTVARYLLEAHHPIPAGSLPWPTLLVNLSGSLAIGLLFPLTERIAPRAHLLRPLVIVGLLGGWTTYSTLAVDATLLAKGGDVVTCLAYLVATVAGGLALVVLGHAIGRKVAST
ncbi:MAG TPA: CrcB family protein [Acidimicrobiales bacterium]